MKVTKQQLSDEKNIIRNEVETCKDCKFEQELGFYYCDYHKSIIKYMKTWQELVRENE